MLYEPVVDLTICKYNVVKIKHGEEMWIAIIIFTTGKLIVALNFLF